MNFVDTLRLRRIEVRVSSSDKNEIVLCCPFCADTRFRMGVNVATKDWHCFNCHAKGRKTLDPLVFQLQLGAVEDSEPAEVAPPAAVTLPPGFEPLHPPSTRPWARKARQYLLQRGVTPDQIREKRLGFVLSGKYAYRIIIPVTYGGKLKGLVCRDFTGQQDPRYLNSRGTKAVYNIPAKKKKKHVMLVEGAFDCWAIERATGKYDVGSLLGHTVTGEQVEMLAGYETLTLWPDPDIPGVKGMVKVMYQLSAQFRERYVVLPNMADRTADPGSMSPEEVRMRLREYLRPWSDLVGSQLLSQAVFAE